MHTPTHLRPLSLDDVTIVIVTYFSASCIPNLSKTLGYFKHVVFVDNGSTDNTKALVEQLIPHAKIIPLRENIGFGSANNRAFEICSTSYVAIVNPDIAFTPEAMQTLLSTATDFPDASFIAPQLINSDGKLDVSYRFPRFVSGIKSWKVKGPAAEGPLSVGFASGAFLLAKREVLNILNGFDEDFFLYYEDDDLCSRAFNAGKSIIIEPKAVVTHFSRSSVKTSSEFKGEFFRAKHHTYSKFLFEKKHNAKNYQANLTKKLVSLWLTALLAFILRVLIPSKKYLAYLGRVCGRISGLYELTKSKR
jgi:N-acetylglucosaminyl-diphospho-decaprenol L-rhamnosyltransferase